MPAKKNTLLNLDAFPSKAHGHAKHNKASQRMDYLFANIQVLEVSLRYNNQQTTNCPGKCHKQTVQHVEGPLTSRLYVAIRDSRICVE